MKRRAGVHHHFFPILLPFLLVPLFADTATAQAGFRGGVNLSELFGSAVDDGETRRGLNLGASFGLVGLGPVQLVAEAYYRRKGGRGDIEEFQQAAAAGQPVEVGLDYVEVPVLARVDLGRIGGRLFPYVQGGPAFGWNLECSVEVVNGESANDCADLTENFSETLQDYETGLILGAGTDIHLWGGAGLNLDVRYTQGVTRVTDDADLKNRSLTFMLGYSLSIPGMAGGGGPMMPGGS